MIRTITRIGKSQGVVLDADLLELARLKVGDPVKLTVRDGGIINVTPVRPHPSEEDVRRMVEKTLKDYRRTFSQLA